MTTIVSPCIRVCVLDSRTDSCIGCGRLRREIAGWRGYSDEQRSDIMAELPERLRRMTSRSLRGRGGREARRATAATPAEPAVVVMPPDDKEG